MGIAGPHLARALSVVLIVALAACTGTNRESRSGGPQPTDSNSDTPSASPSGKPSPSPALPTCGVMAAVLQQDGAALRRALRNCSVDIDGQKAAVALGTAARAGQVRLVKALIEAGVDPDARSQNDMSPLILAGTPREEGSQEGESGRLKVVRVLLTAGADVDARDISGTTALHASSFANYASISQRLIEAGANVDVRNDAGMTPLMGACLTGSRAAVLVLLAAGARTELRDDSGLDAASQARRTGHGDLARLIEDAA